MTKRASRGGRTVALARRETIVFHFGQFTIVLALLRWRCVFSVVHAAPHQVYHGGHGGTEGSRTGGSCVCAPSLRALGGPRSYARREAFDPRTRGGRSDKVPSRTEVDSHSSLSSALTSTGWKHGCCDTGWKHGTTLRWSSLRAGHPDGGAVRQDPSFHLLPLLPPLFESSTAQLTTSFPL